MPCRWGLLPFLATIGASPLMTRGCLCLFLACFGFFLALAGLDYWGRRPYPCPYGLFGFLAWVWPGLLFFGLCACLGLLPFWLGLCGQVWPFAGLLLCLLASASAWVFCLFVWGGAVWHGPLGAFWLCCHIGGWWPFVYVCRASCGGFG